MTEGEIPQDLQASVQFVWISMRRNGINKIGVVLHEMQRLSNEEHCIRNSINERHPQIGITLPTTVVSSGTSR